MSGLAGDGAEHDPCYTGWFRCFNEGRYYEAHDLLEHLWLRTRDENHLFFKGLIQLAGAFVHLQKQHLRPWHPKDGRRLRPAARLLALAIANLSPYCPQHMALDVAAVCEFAREWLREVEQGNFTENPWRPDVLPEILLTHGS